MVGGESGGGNQLLERVIVISDDFNSLAGPYRPQVSISVTKCGNLALHTVLTKI